MTDKTSNRIYLIGFMGSGKSHIGKLLSLKLGYNFIDLDAEIEKKGMSISKIFNQKGEDYFRNLEREILLETNNSTKTIISCGGGTPCFFDNMEWMNRNGITIFLNPATEVLVERLKQEKEKRPLLLNKSEDEIQSLIEQLLRSRMEFYQKADYQILEVDEVEIVDEILEKTLSI